MDKPVILDARVVSGSGGGPDKTILNSPRFLEPLGYRMLCAYMHPPDDPGFAILKAKGDALGAPLFSIPDRGPLDPRVISAALRLCRQHRVAVWHGHDYKSNLLGLLLQPLWPMRLVSTVHGWGVRGNRTRLYYGLDRLSLRCYEKVICVSDDLRRECLAAGVAEENCLLLENGVDIEHFRRSQSREAAKAKVGIDPGRVVIGGVGRLSAEKGFDVLLQAAATLRRRGHDLQVLIVGEGEDRQRLQALTQELNLQERVNFAGYVTDPCLYFEAMDVFALSSYREALPNVVLESMALGVPVVASRIAGLPQLIEHGSNGLLVGAGDPLALAAGLQATLIDGSGERMAAKARATVEHRYNFARRIERLAKVYDHMLGRTSTRATAASVDAVPQVTIVTHDDGGLEQATPRLESYLLNRGPAPLSRHPLWPRILARGLGHEPYVLEAQTNGRTCGFLPLAFVRSLLFGRFLVSLPYVNYGGPLADTDEITTQLVDRAVSLADELDVRNLELRCETPVQHSLLDVRMTSKAHMRRTLPATSDELWSGFSPKVRNQIRKGEKSGLQIAWGSVDLLDEFYSVFSRNMRDLGTPVYSRGLFERILRTFPERAELAVVRLGPTPVAGALLLHGWGVSEVPSASSLREHNATCANMFMYWHLLERALQRGQGTFDFGRSTLDSSTFRFKSQWGAQAFPAAWQYYVREGSAADMRPENPRYERLISLWRKLPVSVTRWLGPAIVRGIP